MEHWKVSLDRYLTQEPPDDTWWFEQVVDKIQCTDEQLDRLESIIDKWMDRLFNKYYEDPHRAADLITKTINRFYK